MGEPKRGREKRGVEGSKKKKEKGREQKKNTVEGEEPKKSERGQLFFSLTFPSHAL